MIGFSTYIHISVSQIELDNGWGTNSVPILHLKLSNYLAQVESSPLCSIISRQLTDYVATKIV